MTRGKPTLTETAGDVLGRMLLGNDMVTEKLIDSVIAPLLRERLGEAIGSLQLSPAPSCRGALCPHWAFCKANSRGDPKRLLKAGSVVMCANGIPYVRLDSADIVKRPRGSGDSSGLVTAPNGDDDSGGYA